MRSSGAFELKDDAYAGLLGLHHHELIGLVDELVQPLDRLVGLAARDELAQMADDLPGAHDLRRGVVERVLDIGGTLVRRHLQQSPRRLQIDRRRRERLIELMREAGGELADGAEPLRMQLLHARLDPAPLAQIADEGDEEAAAVIGGLADREIDREARAVLAACPSASQNRRASSAHVS